MGTSQAKVHTCAVYLLISANGRSILSRRSPHSGILTRDSSRDNPVNWTRNDPYGRGANQYASDDLIPISSRSVLIATRHHVRNKRCAWMWLAAFSYIRSFTRQGQAAWQPGSGGGIRFGIYDPRERTKECSNRSSQSQCRANTPIQVILGPSGPRVILFTGLP